MLVIYDDHTPLLGRLAVITEFGVQLAKEYEELFKLGSYNIAHRIWNYYHNIAPYNIKLMFIDERPFKLHGQTWFCLKEVGVDCSGDMHWFTLDQLIICG